jgi:hypothetical protein
LSRRTERKWLFSFPDTLISSANDVETVLELHKRGREELSELYSSIQQGLVPGEWDANFILRISPALKEAITLLTG